MSNKTISQNFERIWTKLKNIKWSDPKVIIGLVALFTVPFVAKHYVMTGLLIGALMAIAIIWLIQKGPRFIRKFSVSYPLTADILFSSIALAMFGGYFGGGLMLGIAAIICALILSLVLPSIDVDEEEELTGNNTGSAQPA